MPTRQERSQTVQGSGVGRRAQKERGGVAEGEGTFISLAKCSSFPGSQHAEEITVARGQAPVERGRRRKSQAAGSAVRLM